MKIITDFTTTPGKCIVTAAQEDHTDVVAFEVDPVTEEAPAATVALALTALALAITGRRYSGADESAVVETSATN